MSKDEYKKLIKTYMNELNIYHIWQQIWAKQYIYLKQINQLKNENHIKYEQIFFNTHNDIVENGYNISML